MNYQDSIFIIADKITKYNFKEIWNVEGNSMSSLSKEEIAEEMFFKGIAYILEHLHNLNSIDVQKIEKDIKNFI